MFSLTRQERSILVFLAVIFFVGSLLHRAFCSITSLRDFENILESDLFYIKLDVNHATVKQLENVPHIGHAVAQRIVVYRQEHGPFQNLYGLTKIPGITPTTLLKIKPHLKVGKGSQP